jgi:hypothetical protein
MYHLLLEYWSIDEVISTQYFHLFCICYMLLYCNPLKIYRIDVTFNIIAVVSRNWKQALTDEGQTLLPMPQSPQCPSMNASWLRLKSKIPRKSCEKFLHPSLFHPWPVKRYTHDTNKPRQLLLVVIVHASFRCRTCKDYTKKAWPASSQILAPSHERPSKEYYCSRDDPNVGGWSANTKSVGSRTSRGTWAISLAQGLILFTRFCWRSRLFAYATYG